MYSVIHNRQTCISDRLNVDYLKVQLWYENIKKQLNLTTAYQIEKYFEDITEKNTNTRTPIKNKWSRYQKGQHTPRKSLVALVEKHIPNSSQILNHPLWEIIKKTETVSENIGTLMEKLSAETQLIVYKSNTTKYLLNYDSKIGKKLIKLSNYDSLAALLIYSIKAYSLKEIEKTQHVSEKIYFNLQVISIYYLNNNMSDVIECLFDLFKKFVFDKTNWENKVFSSNILLFKQQVNIFNNFLNNFFSSKDKQREIKAIINNYNCRYLLLKKNLDISFSKNDFFSPY